MLACNCRQSSSNRWLGVESYHKRCSGLWSSRLGLKDCELIALPILLADNRVTLRKGIDSLNFLLYDAPYCSNLLVLVIIFSHLKTVVWRTISHLSTVAIPSMIKECTVVPSTGTQILLHEFDCYCQPFGFVDLEVTKPACRVGGVNHAIPFFWDPSPVLVSS